MSKNDRGCITQEITDKYGFTQTELRLIPYIQYCCINNQCIEPHKIYPEERDIISNWKSKGYISGGASDVICVSREFWDIMSDVLWESYANKIEGCN